MKSRRKLLIVVGLVITLIVGGRLYARHAAKSFGRNLGQAISMVGRDGFADTAALRAFFADSEMAGYSSRVRHLSFLGGNYHERVNELQAGMLYFSQQMSVPLEQRFASPPVFNYLAIESSDHSDKAVIDGALKLVILYATQF